MNHDETWFLSRMDSHDDLLVGIREETCEHDAMSDVERYFRDVYWRKCAGPWNVRCAAPANVKIRHGRPQLKWRQLHPCRLRLFDRWMRRERSHHRAERLALIEHHGMNDLAEQLEDYIANETTSVPSVGMTIGNAYFRDNIGEYPLTYTDIADVIYAADVDDESEPTWKRLGFNSAEHYELYLDELYADDWQPRYYYSEVDQLENV